MPLVRHLEGMPHQSAATHLRIPVGCYTHTSTVHSLHKVAVQRCSVLQEHPQQGQQGLALETLEQAKTRRQVALYFSMVRRSPCCASLDSRSTSFSSSTWAPAKYI